MSSPLVAPGRRSGGKTARNLASPRPRVQRNVNFLAGLARRAPRAGLQALRLIVVGTTIGLALAYLVGRLESAMFGAVSAMLIGSLAAALAVTALAASYIPARRIARLDPRRCAA